LDTSWRSAGSQAAVFNLEAAKELLNELKARADKADFNLLDNDYSIDELKKEWLRHCEQTLRPRNGEALS
jgi:hypothetical protein